MVVFQSSRQIRWACLPGTSCPLAASAVLAGLLWLVALTGAIAQNAVPDDASDTLRQYSESLDQIERVIQRSNTTDEELEERRTEALWTAVQVRQFVLTIEREADRIRERLRQLAPEDLAGDSVATETADPETDAHGDPTASEPSASEPDAPDAQTESSDSQPIDATDPAAGDAETTVETEVAGQSAALEARLNELTAMVRRANDIEVRAEQLAEDATTILRKRFGERVFKRHLSFLSPQLWQSFIAEFPDGLTRTTLALNVATKAGLSKGPLILLPLIILILTLSFLHVPRIRKTIGRWIERASRQETPSPMGVAIVALVSATSMTFLPLIGLWIVFSLMNLFGLMSIPLAGMEAHIVAAVVFVAASHALALAILAPERPAWRIAPVSSAIANRTAASFQIPTQIVAIGIVLHGLNQITDQPDSVQLVFAGALSILTALATLILLQSVRRRHGHHDEQDMTDERKAGRHLMQIVGFLASLVALAMLIAVLLGFIPLAWFLARQLVWTVLVVASVFLNIYCLDAISTTLFSKDSPYVEKAATLTGLSEGVIAQIAILLAGIGKVVIGLAGLIAVAVPWGLSSASFVDQIEAFFTGFNIGDLRISFTDVLTALLILMAGIALTRVFQSWLTKRYLPNTQLDEGLKNSLTTATGYIGLIIAIVIAFSSIGIDLSRLALVAGALSVGIGFGLQSIVNNFVSGLILLAERPIKSGDWIEVAGEQGIVKHISVRSTELQTFDRATVLIPNSDLISGKLKNMVFGNTLGRVTILIGVSYGTDMDQARDILLDIAKANDRVLSYPQPYVLFLDFGDSALNMRLDVFIADVGNSLSVRSEINFAILREFRSANIEIPFPQTDLNLRDTTEARELFAKGVSTSGASPAPDAKMSQPAGSPNQQKNDQSGE